MPEGKYSLDDFPGEIFKSNPILEFGQDMVLKIFISAYLLFFFHHAFGGKKQTIQLIHDWEKIIPGPAPADSMYGKVEFYKNSVFIPSFLHNSDLRFLKLTYPNDYKFAEVEVNGESCLVDSYSRNFVAGNHIFIPMEKVLWNQDNQIVVGVSQTPKNLPIQAQHFSITEISFSDKHKIVFKETGSGLVASDSIRFHFNCISLDQSRSDKLKVVFNVYSDTLKNRKQVVVLSRSASFHNADSLDAYFSAALAKLPGPGYYTTYLGLMDGNSGDTLFQKSINVQISGLPSYPIIRPAEPKNWYKFWQKAIRELARIPPDFRMEEKKGESDKHKTYKISFRSIGGDTIYAWFTLPKADIGPMPVVVMLPGYSQAMKPNYWFKDRAVLSVNVRAHGESRNQESPAFPGFFTSGLESPETYIYRGVIMDIYRAVDFVKTRPEIDPKKIVLAGGSQGGYLSVCASGLRDDICCTISAMAAFANYREYFRRVTWPATEFLDWSKTSGVPADQMFKTLSYFDAYHFAKRIKNPVFYYAGLQDNTTPALPIKQLADIPGTRSTYKLLEENGHNISLWKQPMSDLSVFLKETGSK